MKEKKIDGEKSESQKKIVEFWRESEEDLNLCLSRREEAYGMKKWNTLDSKLLSRDRCYLISFLVP